MTTELLVAELFLGNKDQNAEASLHTSCGVMEGWRRYNEELRIVK